MRLFSLQSAKAFSCGISLSTAVLAAFIVSASLLADMKSVANVLSCSLLHLGCIFFSLMMSINALISSTSWSAFRLMSSLFIMHSIWSSIAFTNSVYALWSALLWDTCSSDGAFLIAFHRIEAFAFAFCTVYAKSVLMVMSCPLIKWQFWAIITYFALKSDLGGFRMWTCVPLSRWYL